MDAFRSFGDLLESDAISTHSAPRSRDGKASLLRLRSELCSGLVRCVSSPLYRGQNRQLFLVYADWTATGRVLPSIETFLRRHVHNLYGSTHTTLSASGAQSTAFRQESRQLIAEMVNAKITGQAKSDCVLFAGSGATAALHKLSLILGLGECARAAESDCGPVVFVSEYEHHSNLLLWRESGAEVVAVKARLPPSGGLDLADLVAKLKQYQSRAVKVGSFAAASNVTGMLNPVYAIAAVLHLHKALAVFDFATAAPYARMDMNPVTMDAFNLEALQRLELEDGNSHVEVAKTCYLDAICFSGHKFLGGPNSPGVLVVKRVLLSNEVPSVPGGGTVFYVTDGHQRYLKNKEEREEGGTPDILGSVRLGLAMKVKADVGHEVIQRVERRNATILKAALGSHPCIVMLGVSSAEVDEAQADLRRVTTGSVSSSATALEIAERLPIASFLIRVKDKFLHYGFVCALLNDLFGIQSRGGCVCAGPYSQQLLGLGPEQNRLLEAALLQKQELLRPGFTRISLPYFMPPEQAIYVVKAVRFVASEGFRLLPWYQFNHKTGEWKHFSRIRSYPDRKWLSDFSVGSATEQPPCGTGVAEPVKLEEELKLVQREVVDLQKQTPPPSAPHNGVVDETLRWFVWQAEVSDVEALLETVDLFSDDHLLEGLLGEQPVSAEGDLQRIFDAVVEDAPKSAPTGPSKATAPQTSKPHLKPLTGPVRPQNVVEDWDAWSAELSEQQNSSTETQGAQVSANGEPRAIRPPKKLLRSVGQAIRDWNMIEDGDRLCLGLSGGKDSLSLLHVLLDLQKRAPVKFSLACATVDPETPSFDPRPLIPYVKSLGVTYHFLGDAIVDRARISMQGDSLCSFCSRMKRGMLYTCCEQHRYNKLVLAQHLDDLNESFIMSALHNGQLRTMKANYEVPERSGLRVIRPLVYSREAWTKEFASKAALPVINENCPACFEQPKERDRIKKLLKREESLFPELPGNIRRAILPLMDDRMYESIKELNRDLEERQKTNGKNKKKNGSKGNRKRAAESPAVQESDKRVRET